MSSPMEQWGRALEGASAGMQGRTPSYVMEDRERRNAAMAQEQMGMQREQLDIARGTAERQNRVSDAQIAELQHKTLKGTLEMFQDFIAQAPDDESRQRFVEAAAPKLVGLFGPSLSAVDRPLVDADLMKRVLMNRGSHDGLMRVFAHLLTDDDKRGLAQVKDPTKRYEQGLKLSTENSKLLLRPLMAQLKGIVPTLGLKQGELADPSVLLGKVKLDPAQESAYLHLVEHAPDVLDRAFNAFGIMGPAQMAKAQQTRAGHAPQKPFMTEGLGNYLTASETFKGLGITPEQLTTDPRVTPDVRAKIEAEARGMKEAAETRKAATAAGTAATAVAEGQLQADQKRPYADWQGREKGMTYRNKQTGEEADPNTPMGELRRNAGYGALTDKREQSFREARTLRAAVIPQWRGIVQELGDAPGENWKKALEAKAQQALGQGSLSVKIEALKASLLSVARTVNAGVASQLSDRDLQTVTGAVVTLLDGKKSATQRLDILERFASTLEGIALGRIEVADAQKALSGLAKESDTITVRGATRIK